MGGLFLFWCVGWFLVSLQMAHRNQAAGVLTQRQVWAAGALMFLIWPMMLMHKR